MLVIFGGYWLGSIGHSSCGLEEQQEGQPNEILRSLMDMAEASPDK